jgi:hypothetical protein
MPSDRRLARRLTALGVACCLGTALIGCGGKNYEPPAAADPVAARAALEKALGAWRARVTPEEFLKAESITVADPDWRSEHRLIDFQIQAGEQALGSSIYWPVRLRVVGPRGQEQTFDVTYIIFTNPIIHISRQD